VGVLGLEIRDVMFDLIFIACVALIFYGLGRVRPGRRKIHRSKWKIKTSAVKPRTNYDGDELTRGHVSVALHGPGGRVVLAKLDPTKPTFEDDLQEVVLRGRQKIITMDSVDRENRALAS
jgi:hypothetical protein